MTRHAGGGALDVFERLAATRRAMEEGLAAFDGASPAGDAVGDALDRMGVCFDALGDPATLGDEVGVDERARLATELEGLARLNAVLTAALSRDKERLIERLAIAKAGRRQNAEAYGEASPSGRRCDLSG